MKTNLKNINSYTRELEVIISWDILETAYQLEFKTAQLKYSIPGFRKGKVPLQMVKKNLGPSIEANFAENSINKYYREALEKLEIVPINQASIENLNFKEGSDLSFSARFEIHPQVVLPKYEKKIKFDAIRYLPETEDIDQAIENYREQHASIKTIDSGAESGHFISGNFQVLDEKNLPVVGSVLENQYIRLGFGLFKNDAEKVFIGAKPGDEVLVTIEGKDKPLNYKVNVNRVEEQILPEIDNDLAKSINEKFDSLEDLKNEIKKNLQLSLDKDHKELIRNEIINYFVDNSKLEAPESMVTLYLDQIREDLKKRKESVTEDDLIKNYKNQAQKNIKWYLLKDQIVVEEGIDVRDEEIDNRIEEIILENKKDSEQIKNFFNDSKNKTNLYNEMINDKLFDCLCNYAKIKVIEKSTNELRKKQAA